MPTLTEPWDDSVAEREVLVDLLVPAAQAQYDQALHRWSGLDAKAFALLALVAAAIGGLATTHSSIHSAWWIPAVGLAVSGLFFFRTIGRRELLFGPEIIDFHDEMRAADPLQAARTMVELLTDATESAEDGYRDKGWNFEVGLAIFSISLVGCLPILLLRP